MAGPGQYTTLAAVKARLDRTDVKDDAALTALIAAASRHIDATCNRTFGQVEATRLFQALRADELAIDDLASLTSLKTDDDGDRVYETTWAATDYDLLPVNAGGQSWPFTAVQLAPNGRYAFPRHVRGVQIAGVWGWPEVPAPVAEAAVLLTIRLLQRKNAPYGIAGAGDLGQPVMIGRSDPDVTALLAPYRRFALGVV